MSKIYQQYLYGGSDIKESEQSDQNNEYYKLEDKYFVINRAANLLDSNIIHWGAFLEIHGRENITESDELFDEIKKVLNLKKVSLDILKKVYKLSNSEHIKQLNNDSLAYEIVSYAIKKLFFALKDHFEKIVLDYVKKKNMNINKSLKKWQKESPDSSSIILLHLNDIIKELDTYFVYKGFCPKVPIIRLHALLEFPLFKIIDIIKKIDPEYKHINYDSLSDNIINVINNDINKPKISDTNRSELSDITIIDYTDKILEIRHALVPYLNQYAKYYIEKAEKIMKIADLINKI